ncbi:MAG: ABC transporter permease subunit [Bdellovibrio sp.]|nr:MAG: ABC transporter permease subunit [Bdellovibrio sp.]
MIEKLFKNPLALKRYRRFKAKKRSVISSWILLIILFISITAEFWANNKPILLYYKHHLYAPVFFYYHPSLFGQKGFVTDYRKLELSEQDWSLWPPIRWGPNESNKSLEEYPSPPSSENLLGTDDRGRDVLTRLIYGFRYSFIFSILVWLGAFSIGIALGAFMGFFGGKVDLIGQRLVEIFESLPYLLLLITLISIFGANIWLLIIFSSLFGWMSICQYTRAEFLKLRKREFVEAARALGVKRSKIIFRHVLPNALGPALTFSPFRIAISIYSLAILDFLGFGLPPPTPSWGELLQQAYKNFTIAWWLAVFPSMALFLTLVVLNLIGEGFRDAFDPHAS